ncbi:MAG: hypothetical protein DME22_06675 [Verrucomicrobia bacterium]|nr:MAG: hypothetical protein DME22_06675 [Verrucomicrobiota bacterium]PYJ98181.1 MAG: hypothetical protein DME23_12880 [Verrucomicrobiota bacterium]
MRGIHASNENSVGQVLSTSPNPQFGIPAACLLSAVSLGTLSMKSWRSLDALVVIGKLLTAFAPMIQAQNVLTNGSFEISVPPSRALSLRPGSTNLPGWSIGVTSSLDLVRAPVPGWSFTAAQGQQWVDFNGMGVTLSQSFPTVAGETYETRFTVGRFQSSLPYRLQVTVLTDSGGVLTNLEAVIPLTTGWAEATAFRFVATTPTSTIRFTDTTGTGNYDLTLDDVSVERVTPRLSIECSHVRICWDSLTNHTYQLQYRSELTTNAWTDLGTPIAGIGATDCTVQPLVEPRRFYRIVRLP